MIYQGIEGIKELAEDAGGLLIASVLFLSLGLCNAMLPWNRRDRGFRARLVIALALLLFLFAVGIVIVQDRVILASMWQQNPILYSLMYLIVAILGIVGLGALFHWKLRPKLWREGRHERSN